jgi:hypothetical protein
MSYIWLNHFHVLLICLDGPFNAIEVEKVDLTAKFFEVLSRSLLKLKYGILLHGRFFSVATVERKDS